MKKIVHVSMAKIHTVVLCIMLLSAGFAGAQTKYQRTKTEKKADKCTYFVYEGPDTDVVVNKKNVLVFLESSFVTKIEGSNNFDNVVKFNERQKVDDLVQKIIAPFYKNYKSKSEWESEQFDITLYSKTDGKVCELRFEYDRDANIPLTAIEKLEREILALGLKIAFDPNSYFVKDAAWVYYPVNNSVKMMKAKLRENGN